MADIGSLNVAIGANIDAFEAALEKVQQGVGRLADGLKSAGQNLSLAVTAPLTLFAGAALKTAGDFQALEKGFAATYKGSESLSVALAKVQDLAKLPGLGLREALEGATNLQAAGFSAEQARKSLQAFGNALATVGKGKAELERVSLALTQINNTPFVQGQDLNQLRQTLPQIGEALKSAFGTTSAEGLRKLGVTSKEFIAKITDEFAKLPPVTGGLKNAFENLSDAGTLALSKLGASLNKSFNLEALADKISSGVKKAVDAFTSLDPSTQKLIFTIGAAAASLGPLLLAIGSVGAAIGPLSAGFTLLTGPVGLVVAAVAGAAVLIVRNWDTIVAYFTTGEGARVFGDLADSVKSAGATIGSVFEQLSASSGSTLGGLISNLRPVQNLVRELGDGITGVIDTINGLVTALSGLATLDFKKAAAGGEQLVSGLTRPLRSLFGLVEEKSADFNDFFKDILPTGEAAAGAIDQVAEAAKKAAGLTADQIKALQALEKKLADNRNASLALGDSYDYQGNRSKILTSGIQDLVSKGFDPAGAAVQRYKALLDSVPQAYDQIALRAAKGVPELFKDDNEFKLQGTKLKPQPLPPVSFTDGIAVDSEGLATQYDAALAKQKSFTGDFTQRQADFNTNIEQLSEDFGASIGPLIAGVAVQIGDAFGSIVTNTADAGDALTTLFGGILQALGSFMSQFGQQLIAIGIGKLALDTLFAGPQGGVLAIAAGVGLVALAGIASAVGKSASASVKSIGSGGSSLSSSPSSSIGSGAGGNSGTIKLVAEFKLRGKDLVAVGRTEDYRSLRTD